MKKKVPACILPDPEEYERTMKKVEDSEDYAPAMQRLQNCDLSSALSSQEVFGNISENEPEEIRILREIAGSLEGRQADIYEALLVQYAGGKAKISMTGLARKWGVSVTQICKDRDRILRMIREKISPVLKA